MRQPSDYSNGLLQKGVTDMRKIIGGKLYDTETATKVCAVSPPGLSQGDFRFEDTWLFRSPRGAFFISGQGGPYSRWARPDGENGVRSGEGLQLMSEAEARGLCEQDGTPQQFVAAFGEPEEG
jgi:hypothetical protein